MFKKITLSLILIYFSGFSFAQNYNDYKIIVHLQNKEYDQASSLINESLSVEDQEEADKNLKGLMSYILNFKSTKGLSLLVENLKKNNLDNFKNRVRVAAIYDALQKQEEASTYLKKAYEKATDDKEKAIVDYNQYIIDSENNYFTKIDISDWKSSESGKFLYLTKQCEEKIKSKWLELPVDDLKELALKENELAAYATLMNHYTPYIDDSLFDSFFTKLKSYSLMQTVFEKANESSDFIIDYEKTAVADNSQVLDVLSLEDVFFTVKNKTGLIENFMELLPEYFSSSHDGASMLNVFLSPFEVDKQIMMAEKLLAKSSSVEVVKSSQYSGYNDYVHNSNNYIYDFIISTSIKAGKLNKAKEYLEKGLIKTERNYSKEIKELFDNEKDAVSFIEKAWKNSEQDKTKFALLFHRFGDDQKALDVLNHLMENGDLDEFSLNEQVDTDINKLIYEVLSNNKKQSSEKLLEALKENAPKLYYTYQIENINKSNITELSQKDVQQISSYYQSYLDAVILENINDPLSFIQNRVDEAFALLVLNKYTDLSKQYYYRELEFVDELLLQMYSKEIAEKINEYHNFCVEHGIEKDILAYMRSKKEEVPFFGGIYEFIYSDNKEQTFRELKNYLEETTLDEDSKNSAYNLLYLTGFYYDLDLIDDYYDYLLEHTSSSGELYFGYGIGRDVMPLIGLLKYLEKGNIEKAYVFFKNIDINYQTEMIIYPILLQNIGNGKSQQLLSKIAKDDSLDKTERYRYVGEIQEALFFFPEEQKALLNELITLFPDYVGPYRNLAEIYFYEGNFEKSLLNLQKERDVCSLDPELNSDFKVNTLLKVNLAAQKYDEFEKIAQKTLKDNPENKTLIKVLSAYYFKNNQPEKGIQLLENAIENEIDWAPLALAKYYAETSQINKSKEALNKGKELIKKQRYNKEREIEKLCEINLAQAEFLNDNETLLNFYRQHSSNRIVEDKIAKYYLGKGDYKNAMLYFNPLPLTCDSGPSSFISEKRTFYLFLLHVNGLTNEFNQEMEALEIEYGEESLVKIKTFFAFINGDKKEFVSLFLQESNENDEIKYSDYDIPYRNYNDTFSDNPLNELFDKFAFFQDDILYEMVMTDAEINQTLLDYCATEKDTNDEILNKFINIDKKFQEQEKQLVRKYLTRIDASQDLQANIIYEYSINKLDKALILDLAEELEQKDHYKNSLFSYLLALNKKDYAKASGILNSVMEEENDMDPKGLKTRLIKYQKIYNDDLAFQKSFLNDLLTSMSDLEKEEFFALILSNINHDEFENENKSYLKQMINIFNEQMNLEKMNLDLEDLNELILTYIYSHHFDEADNYIKKLEHKIEKEDIGFELERYSNLLLYNKALLANEKENYADVMTYLDEIMDNFYFMSYGEELLKVFKNHPNYEDILQTYEDKMKENNNSYYSTYNVLKFPRPSKVFGNSHYEEDYYEEAVEEAAAEAVEAVEVGY